MPATHCHGSALPRPTRRPGVAIVPRSPRSVGGAIRPGLLAIACAGGSLRPRTGSPKPCSWRPRSSTRQTRRSAMSWGLPRVDRVRASRALRRLYGARTRSDPGQGHGQARGVGGPCRSCSTADLRSPSDARAISPWHSPNARNCRRPRDRWRHGECRSPGGSLPATRLSSAGPRGLRMRV